MNKWPQSEYDYELFDVCKNRHKGNAESVAAWESIKDRLSLRQDEVLWVIKLRKSHGATVDEIAECLSRTPNCVSGRVTELKIKGLIRKNGTRPTRSGNRAAVLVAI